jgi:hypothetical protein
MIGQGVDGRSLLVAVSMGGPGAFLLFDDHHHQRFLMAEALD